MKQIFTLKNKIQIIICLPLVAIGIGCSISSLPFIIGENMLYLSFVDMYQLLQKITICCFIFALCLFFFKSYRGLSVLILFFCLSFFIMMSIIDYNNWKGYIERKEGLLGYSCIGEYTNKKLYFELEQALAVGDEKSNIRIESFGNNEKKILFGWSKGEHVTNVINRLSKLVDMNVDIQGNPWPEGTVHGFLVIVNIANTNTNNVETLNIDPFALE